MLTFVQRCCVFNAKLFHAHSASKRISLRQMRVQYVNKCIWLTCTKFKTTTHGTGINQLQVQAQSHPGLRHGLSFGKAENLEDDLQMLGGLS